MVRNYLKVAFRNFFKNRICSFINIVGLALGMSVAILIGLWISDELSFDKYQKTDLLTQLLSTTHYNGEISTNQGIAVPVAEELRNKYSDDFKNLALISGTNDLVITAGEKKIKQPGMWVQPGFPGMLTLNMIKGSINALKDPSSTLVSRSLAKDLFGNIDPVNKTVRVNNKFNLNVAGVYEDFPTNSSFVDIEMLLPWDNKENLGIESGWTNHHYQLLAEMKSGYNLDAVNAKIRDITKAHVKGKFDEEIFFCSLNKLHLYGEFKNGKPVGGRIQYVWLFGMIGVLVLLLACINFMNLSTARSEKRSKEVAVRKSIGSSRMQLIGQFLSESILIALLSFIVSIFIVRLSLPFFNLIAEKTISIPWSSGFFWLLLVSFTFFTGLIAGSYPAFYLSGFNPVKVLKGTFRTGWLAAIPRKILVIFQFTGSVILIISTITIFKQIQFAKNRPVGYSRVGLIVIGMNTPDLDGHYNAIRNDLLAGGAVEDMAESSSQSTEVRNSMIGYEWKGKDPNSMNVIGTIWVTHDFGKTIKWNIKEGRDYSRNLPTDTGAIILNEAAVKLTGFKNPVGEAIRWHEKDHIIIGVVKDMVSESPYAMIEPVFFVLDYSRLNYITVRINPGLSVKDALPRIETIFKKYDPASPFNYQFTDDEYAHKFSDEQLIVKLTGFFTILAIFISCLGLFGLASFIAEQRSKEIGLRKVLGATVFNLWSLLSKEFVKLVIISLLIAGPVAYYLMNNWLQDYQYRSDISWWIFGLAGISTLLITILTVSFQAIKAAMINPAKTLRSE